MASMSLTREMVLSRYAVRVSLPLRPESTSATWGDWASTWAEFIRFRSMDWYSMRRENRSVVVIPIMAVLSTRNRLRDRIRWLMDRFAGLFIKIPLLRRRAAAAPIRNPPHCTRLRNIL